ncbi:hypothetical protein VKT23_008242 [Stygiomarasmius scandens]|uniref:Uncharacterized protein n=1 Tax=Marasmiellus scandens TaxID=2682957 RepID=A0ABR1JN15_9AGAR
MQADGGQFRNTIADMDGSMDNGNGDYDIQEPQIPLIATAVSQPSTDTPELNSLAHLQLEEEEEINRHSTHL